MFTGALSAAVVLAASALVSAQTSTECNPLKTTCPADPAFGGTVSCDFTKGACHAITPMAGTTISYGSQGAKFTITQDGQAPTIRSPDYLFFGRVDVVVQAAQGQGIVTSAVLQSDDLDEIDWEWIGGDNTQVQSNYFSKGDTSTYDRGAYHPVNAPLTSYHTYSIEWTSTAVQWIIDGNVVRTLNAADAKGGSAFPQTPMQVKLGTWVGGGASNAPGTVTWAGGKTDFSKAPFNGYYKSITITDYAGANSAGKNSNVKEYVYGDNSGSASSIKVVKGNGSSGNNHAVQPTTGGVKERQTSEAAPQTTETIAAPATTVEKPETKYLTTKTAEAPKETTTAAPEKTSAETKPTVVKETTTESAPKATTTESAPETKPPVVHTTFSTVTAPNVTTPGGSKTTSGSGSGSGSGSSSGSNSGSSSGSNSGSASGSGNSGSTSGSGNAASTPSTTGSGAGSTTTPVTGSASRMVGNTILAAAGLVVLQFFV